MQLQLSRAGQPLCSSRKQCVTPVHLQSRVGFASNGVVPVALCPSSTQRHWQMHALADASRNAGNTNFNSIDFESLLPGNVEECPHGEHACVQHQLSDVATIGLVCSFSALTLSKCSPSPACLTFCAGFVEGMDLGVCTVLSVVSVVSLPGW